jgi:hypothetical protein
MNILKRIFAPFSVESAHVGTINRALVRMREGLVAAGRGRSASYMDEQGRLCRRMADGSVAVINATPAPFNSKQG